MAPRPAPSLFFPLTATAHGTVAYSHSFFLCPQFSVLALILMASGSPVPLGGRSLLHSSAVPCPRSSIRLSDVRPFPSQSVSLYLPSPPSLPSPSSLSSAFLVLVLIFCLVPVRVCPLATRRLPAARRPLCGCRAPSTRCAPSPVRSPRTGCPLRAVLCPLAARRPPAVRHPLSACRALSARCAPSTVRSPRAGCPLSTVLCAVAAHRPPLRAVLCPLAARCLPAACRPLSALRALAARSAPSSVQLLRAVRLLRAVPCPLAARRLPAARRPLSACRAPSSVRLPRAVRSVADHLPASGSPARSCHYIRSAPMSAAFARPVFGPLSCSAWRSAS